MLFRSEPKALALDPQHRVFGRFFNESRSPKRVLMAQGFEAAAAGREGDAEAIFQRARSAPVEVAAEGGSDKGELRKEGRILDGEIALGLTRLHLAQGKEKEAEQDLDQSRNAVSEARSRWMDDELRVLDARLAMRRGDLTRAFRQLHGGFFSEAVDSTEGQLLLAIVAQATGRKDELAEALKAVKQSGADVALLTAN